MGAASATPGAKHRRITEKGQGAFHDSVLYGSEKISFLTGDLCQKKKMVRRGCGSSRTSVRFALIVPQSSFVPVADCYRTEHQELSSCFRASGKAADDASVITGYTTLPFSGDLGSRMARVVCVICFSFPHSPVTVLWVSVMMCSHDLKSAIYLITQHNGSAHHQLTTLCSTLGYPLPTWPTLLM